MISVSVAPCSVYTFDEHSQIKYAFKFQCNLLKCTSNSRKFTITCVCSKLFMTDLFSVKLYIMIQVIIKPFSYILEHLRCDFLTYVEDSSCRSSNVWVGRQYTLVVMYLQKKVWTYVGCRLNKYACFVSNVEELRHVEKSLRLECTQDRSV